MRNNLVAKTDLQESGSKDSKIGRKRQKKFLPKFSFKVFKKSDISFRDPKKGQFVPNRNTQEKLRPLDMWVIKYICYRRGSEKDGFCLIFAVEKLIEPIKSSMTANEVQNLVFAF